MQLSLTTAVAALAPAVGGGGSDGTATPVLPHPGELIFGTVLFVIFLALIWKFVFPKLETAYSERVDAIEGDMSRAERALEEAEATKREYETLLADARREANQMRERGREEGAQIVAEMRTEATAEAQRIIEAANRQVETERAAAMAQLKGEVGRMSTDLAGRIVGESLEDEARSSGVIDRFLRELEDGTLQRELGSGEGATHR